MGMIRTTLITVKNSFPSVAESVLKFSYNIKRVKRSSNVSEMKIGPICSENLILLEGKLVLTASLALPCKKF